MPTEHTGMKWRRVPKYLRTGTQAPPGNYRDWKEELAEEAEHQCVYCAIHDARMGGVYNFHVEHFEPKSKAPERTNDWANLFYACPICNVFKGDDWRPADSPFCYVDPSLVDYETIFERSGAGMITGRTEAAKYMIERIFLNRPQLRLERREYELRSRARQARLYVEEAITLVKRKGALNPSMVKHFADCMLNKCRVDALLEQLWGTTPYERADVRRSRVQ